MSLQAPLVRAVTRFRTAGVFRDPRPLEQRRARLDRAGRTMPRPRRVVYRDSQLAGRPAVHVQVPGAPPDTAILYLHGGSHVAGSPVSHGGLAGRIARSARTDTWVLDHRLAPEHPFPAGRDDAVAACVALAAAGRTRLVLAGDSAGAGLAVAASFELRRRGLATPAGLVLLCPWLDLTLSGASVRGGDDVMLDPDTVARDARAYAGDDVDLAAGDLSPLFADPGDLAGLPPTLLHVAGRDILRSDAERFADRARDAGVAVEVQAWPSMWHVWHSAAPLLPEANAAITAVGGWLRRL